RFPLLHDLYRRYDPYDSRQRTFLISRELVHLDIFFFQGSADHRDLHSFPTRRSSDLSFGTRRSWVQIPPPRQWKSPWNPGAFHLDRKSTRLNSSHVSISYAVFCLKKKTKPIA